MIITCEECSSSFNLDESLLKPTGSKVRCSICKFIFTAYPEEPDDVGLGLDLSKDDEDVEAPDELSTDSTEITEEISEPDITGDAPKEEATSTSDLEDMLFSDVEEGESKPEEEMDLADLEEDIDLGDLGEDLDDE
ncbi:MAG: hypothetical protein HN379_05940, partial [Desulfobacteraceae bacterium]|nr:hypothetical protein [Desulfobacteraceae bacterium]